MRNGSNNHPSRKSRILFPVAYGSISVICKSTTTNNNSIIHNARISYLQRTLNYPFYPNSTSRPETLYLEGVLLIWIRYLTMLVWYYLGQGLQHLSRKIHIAHTHIHTSTLTIVKHGGQYSINVYWIRITTSNLRASLPNYYRDN